MTGGSQGRRGGETFGEIHSFVGHTIYRWLYTYEIGSFLLITINTFIYFLYMFLLLLFRQLDYRLKFFNFLQID